MTLRRLYKLVHPDLFMQTPLARTLNEVSMMRLNEWLDSEHDAATRPVQLSFYVRNASSELRRVDWTVAAGVRKATALAQLLVACGGDAAVPDSDVDADDGPGLLLLPFLESHCLDARRRMFDAMELDREEAILRHVLSQANVRVVFPVAEWRSSKRERIDALAKLVTLVQASEARVRNIRVVVTPRAPLQPAADALGRLLLNVTQTADEWAALIDSNVVGALQQQMAHNAARLRAEMDAATRLGVRLVTGESEALQTSAEYAEWLRRALLSCNGSNAALFPELGVMAIRGPTHLSPRGDMLYVSLEDNVPIVERIAELPVAELRQQLRVRAVLEEQDAQMRVFTKRKLRLAGLLRSNTVALPQARRAVQRLSADAGQVVNYVAGLRISIDTIFDVDAEGTIAIAWNCQ